MQRPTIIPILGSIFAFLLATSCCWLPFLAAAIFGSTVGVAAFSASVEPLSGLFFVLGAGLLGFVGWHFFQKRKQVSTAENIVFQSLITCPRCGFQKTETMPTDACQFFYECENCHSVLRPKQGDCCVFCSFGTVKCPPIQAGKHCC